MAKQKVLKHQVSYKENFRDIKIYTFIEENIKDTLGISSYIKMLVEKDMEQRERSIQN